MFVTVLLLARVGASLVQGRYLVGTLSVPGRYLVGTWFEISTTLIKKPGKKGAAGPHCPVTV